MIHQKYLDIFKTLQKFFVSTCLFHCNEIQAIQTLLLNCENPNRNILLGAALWFDMVGTNLSTKTRKFPIVLKV